MRGLITWFHVSFFIVPAEKKNALLHPREYLKGKASTKYYLYFVCAHSKVLVDAPVKIRLTKEWVIAAAPALVASLKIVQFGLSVANVPLNLDGFAYHVTTTGIDQMLSEVTSIMADAGSHNDLLRRLKEGRPLSNNDVPELEGEAYKLVVEKATEQSAWRSLMELVRTARSPAAVWVTKDVASDSTLGYVKARPGYS
jgi:hypothetical protein